MKANAISSDAVFSPVLFFNKNVMGMVIDNVANTVVNVSINADVLSYFKNTFVFKITIAKCNDYESDERYYCYCNKY